MSASFCSQRELLPKAWNPPQDYAEILVLQALSLKPGRSRAEAEGPGGVKFRIVGLRLGGLEETAILSGLGDASFDRLAVVLFQRDFQIDRAVVLPKDLVAANAARGALSLTPEVLNAPGAEEITSKVYRFAGDDFQ